MRKKVVLIPGALTGIGRVAAVAFVAKRRSSAVVSRRHEEAANRQYLFDLWENGGVWRQEHRLRP